MTSPSNSAVQNLLPVQAYFNLDGSFSTFIGQGTPFYATANPVQSGLTITNSTLNSSPIGNTSPSTGVFTNIATTTGTISTQPSAATDIVNLLALQSYAAGISWKQPCAVATLANITLSGLQTIDSYTTLAGDRVLVKNQSTAANNGIYLASATAWTRALDADTWNELICAISFIEYGTQAGGAWFCTAQPGGTLGVTAVNWSQFTTSATYSAGTGLTLTGSQFSITNTGVAATTYGSATASPVFAVNAQGQITSVTNTTITPAIGNVTGLGTNMLAFLQTPTSANLAATVTDETGSGALVFANSPTLITPALGTPASGVVTNLTGTASININGTVGATTANTGAFTYLSTSSTTSTTPTLSFNGSNSNIASGATVSGSYLQNLLQNKSNTAGASTNYVLSNDLGTDSTYYGEFGMNSSVYSASTPADFFSINNGVYFSGHDGDVSIGSGNGYKTYFAWGTTGQSAHVINASGAIGLSTNLGTTPAGSGTTGYGTSGYLMQSGGSAAAPTWVAQSTIAAGSATTATNATNIGITDDTTTATSVYPTWVTTTTGNLPVKTSSTKLSFNPSTGNLTSTVLTSTNDASISGLTVGKGGGSLATSTVVGYQALNAVDTGGYNTAVGNSALKANTSGSLNAAFGLNALFVNTSGTENTGIGTSSLGSNTTGSYNTGIGRSSLYANTTASNNTAVGYQAGYLNTTGSQNTFLGRQSGYAVTTGVKNTAVGSNAMDSNNASESVAVGFGALAVSSGSYNVALGNLALNANTTASNNTAVGYQAGYTNTTGASNTFIGRQAGYATTSGANTFVGGNAGLANTTGQENTFIGQDAGLANTTGSLNTILGRDTFITNTTGGNNTALGYNALYSNTTASNNTAVGYQAGYSITTSAQNTIMGYAAGYSLTTGTGFNTLIGRQAGYSISTGYYNTLVGAGAGTGLTTGVSNTFVGPTGTYASGEAVTTGSKNTILGAYSGNNGGLDIRTSSNYIVLSDGDGNPRGIFDASGNLLVGKTSSSVTANGFVVQPSGNTTNVPLIACTGNSASSSYITWAIYSTSAGGYEYYVDYSGIVHSTQATNTLLSDERLKENIRDIDTGLTAVTSLKPRIFDWKENKGANIKNATGFIAQEFEAVFPNSVGTTQAGADGIEYKNINYEKLVPTLVKAIQELNAKVTALEAQLGK